LRTVNSFRGYARLADIRYGYFGDDGAEDAVIPIDSGTNGGVDGVLIYEDATPGPALAAALPGYRMDAQPLKGVLAVNTPWYFPFQANCCNIAFQRTDYAITGGSLVPVDQQFFIYQGDRVPHPISAQELTVRGFFNAVDVALQQRVPNSDISVNLFRAAYAFLSPDAQAGESFDTFTARFHRWKTVRVDDTATGDAPDEVSFALTVERLGDLPSIQPAGSLLLVPNDTVPSGYALERVTLAGA
ncbi:MAG: hypothetical protein ACYDCQ_15690, partial [Dehalococcoidia bacterium]